MNNYPLNAFPELIRNAVLSVHEQTRAPVPLIASSVIIAVSLTCQGCADVRVSERIVSPVSLFMLVMLIPVNVKQRRPAGNGTGVCNG
ncbi:hypothetical protein [Morganella morganii]|uniref:hypothetical protein n=1 Tax=Morganella morganii TaxID=582 RepID=UPI001890D02E|nr:hypothetical protein [Morganella morganii]